MADLTAIYTLSGPDGAVRYVGKTRDPALRMTYHMRRSGHDLPVKRWIWALMEAGVAPEMRIIEWTHDWQAAETAAIQRYRDAGADILNIARGGEHIPSPTKWSAARRARYSIYYRAVTDRLRRTIRLGMSEPVEAYYRRVLKDLKQARRLIEKAYGPGGREYFDKSMYAEWVNHRPGSFTLYG